VAKARSAKRKIIGYYILRKSAVRGVTFTKEALSWG